jgi:hypothetical protein
VHSETAKGLETLALQVIEGPTKAIQSAQATLDNCQQNLQLLGSYLQATLPAQLSAAKLPSPSSAGPFKSSFTTSPGLRTEHNARSSLEVISLSDERGEGLSEREVAAIEQVMGDGMAVREPPQEVADKLDPSFQGRPLGPLQVGALTSTFFH